jgi:hypothetical protein
MEYWQVISIVIIVFAIGYKLYGKKVVQEKTSLTEEQLTVIDNAISDAVAYAMSMYALDNTVDVKALTIQFALSQISKTGLIPEEYMDFIKTLIETRVTQISTLSIATKGIK